MTNVQRSRRQVRLSRALGIALTPKAQRIFARPYAPVSICRTRRRTESDYAVRLVLVLQRLRAQRCISEQLRAGLTRRAPTPPARPVTPR